MDINTLMFQAVSSLTGGLINDMTTLLLGMVTVFFLAIGFDKIRDVIVADIRDRQKMRTIDEMRKDRYVFENSDMFDPVYSDIARARYNAALNRLSRHD